MDGERHIVDGERQMSFWEHLDELRKVIFRALVLVLVCMLAVFAAKDFVFDHIVLAPLDSGFVLYRAFDRLLALVGSAPLEPFRLQLINIDLAAQFFIHIRVSFWMALVLSVPYILYLLWGFVSPALYPQEKKTVRGAFAFASVLFAAGLLVAYFLVFPLTLRFLGTYQVSASVLNQISLQSYISMFISLLLVMGLVFELPALAAVLSRLGLLNRRQMKGWRKHAVLAMLLVSAVITPSGDAVTMLLVAVPLYLLYELSILLCYDIDQ